MLGLKSDLSVNGSDKKEIERAFWITLEYVCSRYLNTFLL
jgi:hypothetical protein